jgi:multidrug resistance protein MdtO
MTAAEAWQRLRDELTASPDRRTRIVRMTAIVAIVVVVSMALRVPDVALSAYMVFFVTQADAATTVRTGVGLVVGLTLALALSFVFFSIALGEPALRLPLMALLTFAGMYLMRASPAGPLGLMIGFVTAYSLTYADQVPSPEALVRAFLWQWVVVAYPVALIVVADLVFGRRPDDLFREGVAARLAAAAEALDESEPDDSAERARLARLLRLGVADLVRYAKQGGPSAASLRAALVRQVELLGFLVSELPAEVRSNPAAQPPLRRAAQACRGAARALRGRDATALTPFALFPVERHALVALSPAALAVAMPLVRCIETVLLGVRDLVGATAAAAPSPRAAAPRPSPSQRTESMQFALKVTVASMTAYLLYTGLSWFSIHTAMITCFFVARDSLGATVHRLTLRLLGAVVGAALGMAAIIVVLPRLESVGELAILVAAVTLFAAWIGTGSERISYAGWQIALAFYLTALQGFSRTSKIYVGRDRVIGVLVGNILMTVVFTSLWPVRIRPALRQALARSVASLAAMIRVAPDDRRALEDEEARFYADFSAARQYAPLVPFEPGTNDAALVLTRLPGLLIPVHAIAREPVTAASAAARAALSRLHEDAARWLSALSSALIAEGPMPAFTLGSEAVTALETTVDGAVDPPEIRQRLRLHLEWCALLRAQSEQLAARVPA